MYIISIYKRVLCIFTTIFTTGPCASRGFCKWQAVIEIRLDPLPHFHVANAVEPMNMVATTWDKPVL